MGEGEQQHSEALQHLQRVCLQFSLTALSMHALLWLWQQLHQVCKSDQGLF